MKPIFIALWMIIPFTAVVAQDKASLTKDETISYLNRMLNKAVGFKCINVGAGTPTASIETVSFSENGDDICYTYRVGAWYNRGLSDCSAGCGGNYTISYIFNPAYITDVQYLSNSGGDPVRALRVVFRNQNLVREKWTEHGLTPLNSRDKVTLERTTGTATFYFFLSEMADFEKMKKAILYLRDLYKAEEDPFGE